MRSENLSEKLIGLRLPILAGFLIGTSYIPFPPWALFICLAPLLLFWQSSTSAKNAFWGGWLTQFILNLIGFHWIAYTAVEFGGFPWWGGLLSLLGFCTIAHLHYPIAGWLSVLVRHRFNLSAGASFFAMALIFALAETLVPMIFPWHLGYPWLWAGWPGAQVADVIGFEGLNVLTLLVNAALAWAFELWLNRPTGSGIPRKSIGIAATAAWALLLTNIAGMGRAEPWKKTDAEATFLAVQGNIGNFDKIIAEKGAAFRAPIIDKFISMSRAGLKDHPETDLVIWPETAFPSVLDKQYLGEPHALTVLDFVRESQVPILTGSYSSDGKDTFNAIFFVGPDERSLPPPYRKSILLVFGETFPFSDYVPYMDKLFPELGSFGRGVGPKVMNVALRHAGAKVASTEESSAQLANATATRTLKLGPQICYEGLYPDFSMELSRQGAQIFTNVTNDSWFGSRFEPYQHLYMTYARAIEFRRPLMRSTNTGITTAILASGETLTQSPLHTEWVGSFRIPYMTNPPHTFFEKIADRWSWILAIALVLLLVSARKKAHAPEGGSDR